MGCTGCGNADPFARVAAAGGETFEVTLPKMEEPALEDIPFLPEDARRVALLAVAAKGKGFDSPSSVVVVHGMRQRAGAPLALRAHVVPKDSALRILARHPVLAAKVLAKHPEAFELEDGCTCCANAVYLETGGPVAFERLELEAA